MERKNKEGRKKEVAKTILKTIAITGMIAGIIVFPGLAPLVEWIEDVSKQNRSATKRSFYGLKKRGMLRVRNKGKRVELILTDKGRKKVLEYKFQDLQLIKPSHWDGRWRMVMFDVPEAFRSKRDLIRLKLRELGFLSVQKSVYIYPYPCTDLVLTLRSYYNLKLGQLYIFESKVLEGENTLRKHFKI